MAMSRDQNAGQNHNLGIDDKTFERVEQFQYLGTSITNQNSIQEEITSKVKSEKMLIIFSVESFVFQFAIQKYKV
jgi:hypothetical protein